MKIAEDIYVLPIPRDSQGADGFLNLTLILDDDNGNTLVDAGLPGQEEAIGAALGNAGGIGVRDLRRIIFTHQDLDHVGSGAALVRQSGARVLAHPADAPYIEGELRPIKVTPEMLERRPQMREVLERLEPVRVEEYLEEGARLELAGGIRVIFTPGHTPGHLSLYLERPKVLIAGDALTAEGGHLNGPNPSATPDVGEAARSVRRLEELDVETIVCYRGGVVGEDANGQLRRVIQETSRGRGD
jgi:glyoxylase-like metal-dependent hydrolase (beta-lactamase superfamily II)